MSRGISVVERRIVTLDRSVSIGASVIEATGGTVYDVNIEGKYYRIHEFADTGTNTFTIERAPDRAKFDVLVVGGGGSASASSSGNTDEGSGGGGAGGLVYAEAIPAEVRQYSIIVGDGGFGTYSPSPGDDSVFDDYGEYELTALGGGAGMAKENGGSPTLDGGSGGGIDQNEGGSEGSGNQPETNSIPAGTIVHDAGNDGGSVVGPETNSAAGGGGAGQVGGTEPDWNAGGDGIDMSDKFTGTFGDEGWFAGGGAGGLNEENASGEGGLGGGGDSPTHDDGYSLPYEFPGEDGLPNTGGGASGITQLTDGGSWEMNSPDDAANGGSGIILVRYSLD